jgi:hypothetical protein
LNGRDRARRHFKNFITAAATTSGPAATSRYYGCAVSCGYDPADQLIAQ